MAKKKAAKNKTKKTSRSLKSPKKVITRDMYLQLLIDISESQITGSGGGLDLFFTQQADRLKKELKAYKTK